MAQGTPAQPEQPHSQSVFGMCPACEEPLSYNPLAVVSTGSDLTVLHDACRDCRSSVLTVTIGTRNTHTAVSLLTDLTRDEVVRFWTSRSITIDDVIDLHETLANGTTVDDHIRTAFINN